MLGERSEQRGLWEADWLYIDHVGRGSFYGLLASMRGQLFRDDDFAELYCADNGRDSVPPSLLATALLLQIYDRASDAEAKQRADFDIRWKVALGIEVEDRPFAKSTLQLFRARLILHEKAREVFERRLRFARETGYLKSRRMKVVLDTTYILGRGAVKDTYNLLADGIVKLMRALADVDRSDLDEWATAQGYERYVGGSVKGEACIDWDDKNARAALLDRIVDDADRLLKLSRRVQRQLDEDSTERQRIEEASELLGQLLLQDVECTEEGVGLKEGVSRDRIVSVHDPEMRHGHKSSSKRFDGHKMSVAVDTDSQVITAVDVLPGNASDNVGALELVERSEEGTVSEVEETIGDAAYGDGGIRQAFADAGRTLIAKLPRRADCKRFPKEDFDIDLESGACTCPAGHTTRKLYRIGSRTDRTGRTYQLRAFWFDAAVYVAEHGCKWRGLPPRFGRWHTIYTRMNRWAKNGVLDRVFEHLQQEQIVRVKLEADSMDSTMVKVHPDGTGALKKRTIVHRKVAWRLDHQDSYGCRRCSNGHDLLPFPRTGHDAPEGRKLLHRLGRSVRTYL